MHPKELCFLISKKHVTLHKYQIIQQMIEFELKDHEYIQLNQLLKLLRLVGTGGEAHIHIDNGEVIVNGATETQRRKKLRKGDIIEFNEKKISIL